MLEACDGVVTFFRFGGLKIGRLSTTSERRATREAGGSDFVPQMETGAHRERCAPVYAAVWNKPAGGLLLTDVGRFEGAGDAFAGVGEVRFGVGIELHLLCVGDLGVDLAQFLAGE